MLKKWQPKDIIAIIIVTGAISLIWTGKDTVIGFSLLAVICAYYGIDLSPFIHLGRNQKSKERKETKDND